jgi:hypothetical protein
MKPGMIGLGRMGANMALRLMRNRLQLACVDPKPGARKYLADIRPDWLAHSVQRSHVHVGVGEADFSTDPHPAPRCYAPRGSGGRFVGQCIIETAQS